MGEPNYDIHYLISIARSLKIFAAGVPFQNMTILTFDKMKGSILMKWPFGLLERREI